MARINANGRGIDLTNTGKKIKIKDKEYDVLGYNINGTPHYVINAGKDDTGLKSANERLDKEFNTYSDRIKQQQENKQEGGIKGYFKNLVNTNDVKNVLNDGLQMKDIPELYKIGFGTSKDAVTSVAKGILSTGENIGDYAAYHTANALQKAGIAEDYMEEVKRATTDSLINKIPESNKSLLGSSSKSTLQGVGNSLSNMAIGGTFGGGATYGAMFASSAGSATTQKYNEIDKTLQQLEFQKKIAGDKTTKARLQAEIDDLSKNKDKYINTYATISGLAEMGSEAMFGGIAKGLKIRGIGTGAEDDLVRYATRNMSSMLARNLVAAGISATGEGIEEIMSDFGEALAQKASTEKDTPFMELLADQDWLGDFMNGFVSSLITQGGETIKASKAGIDITTGLTQTESDVVKELAKEQQAKDGGKLSDIERDIENKLKEGTLKYEDIQRVLSKDTYQELDTLKGKQRRISELESRIKELDNDNNKRLTSLNEYNSMKEELNQLKNEDYSRIDELTERLENETLERTKGKDGNMSGAFAQSYQDRQNRGVAYQVDENTYNKASKELQGLYDSARRIMNNTVQSRKFIDSMAKLSKSNGLNYQMTNNEELKALGKTVDGKVVNGLGYRTENGNTVLINVDAADNLNTILGHETTHFTETAGNYKDYQKFLQKNFKDEYDSLKAKYESIYEGLDADIDSEITAQLTGEKLFNDPKFIEKLTEKPTLFNQIKNFIDDLVTKFIGTKEEKQLKDLQKRFQEVYDRTDFKKAKDSEFSLAYAKTSQLNDTQINRLKNAVDLKKDGYTDEQIWNKTGVVVGDTLADTKIYIPDLKFKDTDKLRQVFKMDKMIKLTDVMEGDLFDVYPQLKNTTIGVGDLAKYAQEEGQSQSEVKMLQDVKGAIDEDNNIILNTNINTLEEAEGIISHEVQHIIQAINGLNENTEEVFKTQGRKAYKLHPQEIEAEVNRVLNKMTPYERRNTSLQSIEEEIRKYYEETGYKGLDINKVINRLKNKHGIQYSLSTDSQGRELTKQQQEYFKDSKVRDDDGRLLEVYHGTPNYGFTVFDTNKSGQNTSSGEYGLYFTDSKEFADDFSYERIETDSMFFDKRGAKGDIYPVYLNATNVLDFANLTEQEINDLYNYASGLGKLDGKEKFVKNMLKWQQIGNHQLMKGNLDLKAIADNSNYDGIKAKLNVQGNENEYIVFNSNQIKNVDNTNPTSNPDIRYSLAEDNEGRKLTESQEKYFKNSQARDEKGNLVTVYHTMTDKGVQFNEFNPVGTDFYKFGDQVVNYYTDSKEMSGSYADQNYYMADTKKIESIEEAEDLVKAMNKGLSSENTIRLEKKDNGYQLVNNTYKDAYDYAKYIWDSQFTDEEKQIEIDYENLYKKYVESGYDNNLVPEFTSLERYAKDYSDHLDKVQSNMTPEERNIFTELRRNRDGVLPDYINIEPVIMGEYANEDELFRKLKSDIQKADYESQHRWQYEGYVNLTNPYIIDAEGRTWNKIESKGDTELTKKLLNIPEDTKKNLSMLASDSIKTYNENLFNYQQAERAITDFAQDRANTTLEQRLVHRTIHDLGFDEFMKILNNEKVYWGHKEQFMDDMFNNGIASLKQRQEYNKTGNIPTEVLDAVNKLIHEPAKYEDRYMRKELEALGLPPEIKTTTIYDIWNNQDKAYKTFDEGGRYEYSKFDKALEDNNTYGVDLETLFKTAKKGFTDDYIRQAYNDWSVTNDIVKKIIDLNKYGENYDGVIMKNVIDYGGESENHEPHDLYITFNSNQFKAVDNLTPTEDPDIRYSLQNQNEQLAPYNPNGIYGRDVRLENQQVREDIDTLRDVNETAPIQRPLDMSTNEERRRLAEERGWETFDEVAPIRENLTQEESDELDYLEDIDNSGIGLEYDEEQRMNELRNAENPINEEVDEDTSLEDIRSYDAVGNRKVKAYQYEHPEVKPFFQEEARELLRELNNSIKAEKFAIPDDTKNIGDWEWTGIKRQISDDLAELLDGDRGFKYDRDEIRKGLNAIIEDHGAENIAVAKRLEFYIDERLRNGYDLWGVLDENGEQYHVEPNQDYLNFLREQEWNDYYESIPRAALDELAPTRDVILNADIEGDIAPTMVVDTQSVPKGKGRSSYWRNIGKQDFLTDESKELIQDEDDVKYYKVVSNKETLNNALDKLRTGGTSEVLNWNNKFQLDEKGKVKSKVTAEDIAEGWILMKQYQDSGNYDAMVQVAKTMRNMGTEGGRVIQAFNIMSRMTPEGMVKYAQSELTEAFDKASKNKSKQWIDMNEGNFDLTPDETRYIIDTMNEVQNMEDGYEKKVKLAQIQALISNKIPTNLGNEIKSWMRISMLFNPKTQVRNVAGNAVIVPVNAAADVFSSAIDRFLARKTGVRTTGTFNVKAALEGLKRGAYEATNDYKLGINTKDVNMDRFEAGQGKSFTEKTIIGKALNKTESLLNYVMDLGDRVFSEAVFENSLQNQMELNDTTEITQDMLDIARTEALQRTWNDNNNYTKFVLDIRKALNKVNFKGYGLGDVLIPFAKTPANLTKAIVDYSPVGLVNSLIKGKNLKNAIETGKFTAQQQHEFVQTLGKATAGTLLYVLGYALAKAGISTGKSDEDKDVSNFLKNTLGVSSYSIKIGDKSYTYDWAQPIAAPFSITANIVSSKNSEEALAESIVSNLDTAGSILMEQSFLQSLNETLNNNDGVVNGLLQQALELPSRAIPTFSKQIADLTDDTQRQTFEYNRPLITAVNKMKSKIPGLSQDLAPVVDTMGREVKKYGGKNNLFNVFLNPANVNTENISSSAQEIYDLYKETGDKTIMPRTAPYYVNKKGEKIVLTSQQKAEYQKISGGMIEAQVQDLMNNTQYINMTADEKAAIVKKIVDYSYNIAQHDVLGTEVSQTYQTAYLYSKVGNVNDWYLLKSQEFTSDKNEEGKTISGSLKKKVVNYVNEMDISAIDKVMLIELNGYRLSDYDMEVFNYINSMDLSYDDKLALLKKMGIIS